MAGREGAERGGWANSRQVGTEEAGEKQSSSATGGDRGPFLGLRGTQGCLSLATCSHVGLSLSTGLPSASWQLALTGPFTDNRSRESQGMNELGRLNDHPPPFKKPQQQFNALSPSLRRGVCDVQRSCCRSENMHSHPFSLFLSAAQWSFPRRMQNSLHSECHHIAAVCLLRWDSWDAGRVGGKERQSIPSITASSGLQERCSTFSELHSVL